MCVTDQSGEGSLWEKQMCAALIFPYFHQGLRPWAISPLAGSCTHTKQSSLECCTATFSPGSVSGSVSGQSCHAGTAGGGQVFPIGMGIVKDLSIRQLLSILLIDPVL